MDVLPFFFMNAAGWAKELRHVEMLAKVPLLTHIVVGSFTPDERKGNKKKPSDSDFCVGPEGIGTNSIGLKNYGFAYLREHGPEMVRIAHAAGKKLIISIAGFCANDYFVGAQVAISIGADGVEFNAGCPNVLDGEHSEIVSYSDVLLRELTLVGDSFHHMYDLNWWLKVSPMANPRDIERVADTVRRSSCNALVATNTFPNVSLYHPDGRPFLDVANNYGGMSGSALKPIALSNCRKYRELLPDFPIIGVGGIDSGYVLHEFLDFAECSGAQVGTAFFNTEDTRRLNDIPEVYMLNHYTGA